MKTSRFDYELPEELIAKHPAKEREGSKLLVFGRRTKRIEHHQFRHVREYMRKGDTLVVNDSRVFKARFFGTKQGSGGEVELLCLHPVERNFWKVICKPARRIRNGTVIEFGGSGAATVTEELKGGERILEFSEDPLAICEAIGELPLPPYIKRKPVESDLVRYQTVYSNPVGSVAAPTAGLHFTDELLNDIRDQGVEVVKLTLHVGWGTFKPVSTDKAEDHSVEQEWYSVNAATARQIVETRRRKSRIFVVGTTSTRALESWYRDTSGTLVPASGFTDLFIYPPYKFNLVDKLVTNFHLPKSSLLMLVSAFAGRKNMLRCYRQAVKHRYRFYSYGDAMLIL